MGRGLSPMQRDILKLALDGPIRFQTVCKEFFPDYDPDTQIYCSGDSLENIRRANSVQASVSRSLRRLEKRGLITRLRGHYADYANTLSGYMEIAVLTVNSRQLAKRLEVAS